MGIFHNSCMPISSKCGYFTTLKKCVFREMEIVTEYFTNDNHCFNCINCISCVPQYNPKN